MKIAFCNHALLAMAAGLIAAFLTVPFGASKNQIDVFQGICSYGEVGVRWYVSWNEQGRLLRLHSQRWKICDNLQKRQLRQGSHVVIENSETGAVADT